MTLPKGACLLVLALPTLGWAQVPAGPEFLVNTYTTGNQMYSSLASAGSGDFVVAWGSANQEAPGFPVFAQRYDAAGLALGGEFRVDQGDETLRTFPDVAANAAGEFVVAWQVMNDGNGYGIFAQRYDAAGNPRGGEFAVNTYTESGQTRPAAGIAADGSFVVAWASVGQDTNLYGVFGQRFDAAGARVGFEFQANAYFTGQQRFPDVASDAFGNFVVVWQSLGQDGSSEGVFAQRFAASGARRGAEFRVNTYTTSVQSRPVVALDPDGNFVVAWRSYGQDGSAYGVFARRFDASGAPRGGEFQVNVLPTLDQSMPSVATDANGNFVVAWQSYAQDGALDGVFARRFAAAGSPRGTEFRVNTYTTSVQDQPSVAVDAVGNFVVAWESLLRDGSDRGVLAQRFGGLHPVALRLDATGNDVFEPGEAVVMQPAWGNVNGLPQTFGGILTGLAGPPGPVYTIDDPIASYGTVGNGESSSCIDDCYGVSVSAPPQRPLTHWDLSVTETITPDTLGQQIRWRLHLGDSFTDVPRTNPFYHFVETLLHHGVTGGCGAGLYCPSTPTSREQMAVFVLTAKEGENYAPPACAPPNVFEDVPETSPFCRYIEELSNRGVVSGCATGRYCPSDPVTREQMAVFVLRTLDPALSPPPCTTPVFADVPASSPFCRWIEELARRGVVGGCAPSLYCPTSPVSREQMGPFLAVTFGLTLYGP